MGDLVTYHEQHLLKQIAAGDEKAYEMLFRRYWNKIVSTALLFVKSPELAEDLAQDVFAKIWINRTRLATVEKFESYLFIMSRNAALNKLSREIYTSRHLEFFETYFEEKHRSPENSLESRQATEIIEAAIRSLPEQQQLAFRLSRFEGLSHQQIAERMGLSIHTVASHISRALINLRTQLGNHASLVIILWILLFL